MPSKVFVSLLKTIGIPIDPSSTGDVDEFSRDGGQARFQEKVGLPLATYFSGPKVRWILDNVDGAREKAEAGNLAFGNMDTWVIWNLTGGSFPASAWQRSSISPS